MFFFLFFPLGSKRISGPKLNEFLTMIQQCHKPAEIHLSFGETLLSPNTTSRGYASRRTEKKPQKTPRKQTTQSRRDYTQNVSFFQRALGALYPLTSTVSRWPWAELVTSTVREGRGRRRRTRTRLRFNFSGVPSKLWCGETCRSSPSLRGDEQQLVFRRKRAAKTGPRACEGSSPRTLCLTYQMRAGT